MVSRARPFSQRSIVFSPAQPAARAGAAHAGSGGLQVRRSAHHRRPHRKRPARGRRRDRRHAVRHKSARVKSIEAWPAPEARARRAQAHRRPIDRHHARSRPVRRARRRHLARRSRRPRSARGCGRGCSGCIERPLDVGAPLTVRIGTAEATRRGRRDRAGHRSGPAGCDDGARRSRRTTSAKSSSRCRGRSPPIRYTVNPGTGRIVLDFEGRIAGGGLILAADRCAIPNGSAPAGSPRGVSRTGVSSKLRPWPPR